MWIFFVIFFCYTLPCFFGNFGGLSLPCHLLCCLLLFIYLFYLFIYLFFFYLHGFSVFFVSLIALGTSSLRRIVFLLGVGCTGPPFRGQVSKGSKLYN